jgi:tRNA-dihydrouridine synthase
MIALSIQMNEIQIKEMVVAAKEMSGLPTSVKIRVEDDLR